MAAKDGSNKSSATYYEILGVSKNSSPKEVKSAYRKRAKETASDKRHAKITIAEIALRDTLMQKINEAYEVLGNAENRARYDNEISKYAEHIKQEKPSTGQVPLIGKTIYDARKSKDTDTSSGSPPETGSRKIFVNFKKTPPHSPDTIEAHETAKEFIQEVEDAGIFSLDPDESSALSDQHGADFSGKNFAVALQFAAYGVNTDQFATAIDKSEYLNLEEKEYLNNINQLVTITYESTELGPDLEAVGQFPEVGITPLEPQDTSVTSFQFDSSLSGANRVISPVTGRIKSYASDKTKGFVSSIFKKKVKGKVAKAVGKKVAKKVALKAAASAAGTTLGGPIGTAVALVAVKALGIASKSVKDIRDLVGGLILGAGQIASTVGTLILAYFAALGAVLLAPFAIAIGSILFIIFTVYIMTVGGWIVPPWGGSSIPIFGNSIYIDVEKVANPTIVTNPEVLTGGGKTIAYTVTVSASKSTLTNIIIIDTCSVRRTSNFPPCPPAVPSIPQPGDPGYPTFITAGNPYTFSYTRTFTSAYTDALVTDVIKVTADAEGIIGEQSTGSANVIIGNPPTGCFTFTSNWPVDDKAQELLTIAQIMQAGNFMNQLCSRGAISLDWKVQNASYGGWTRGYKDIVIYPLGVGDIYTLVHESGHVLAGVTTLYTDYINTPGLATERPICTYPFLNHTSGEDFAEMVADYFVNGPLVNKSFACLPAGAFISQYPQHWQFGLNFVYLDRLGW